MGAIMQVGKKHANGEYLNYICTNFLEFTDKLFCFVFFLLNNFTLLTFDFHFTALLPDVYQPVRLQYTVWLKYNCSYSLMIYIVLIERYSCKHFELTAH